ncbi:MAG: NAD(P)H-hydrate dehydratase [Spirochaetaceae bacterium]|jgi:NAD(P)H-hydrate epimerase|nr:NAD(P)H-hydrate dehydratase [Spirochaetaceae bacterium]
MKWMNKIPPISKHAHKYDRGVVEIHAGSVGAVGAAVIAARGAAAAGAGLVRLLVDEAIYPIAATALAVLNPGIMVAPAGTDNAANDGTKDSRFVPDAIVAGCGWGRGPERKAALQNLLAKAAGTVPLVLDADAIALLKNIIEENSSFAFKGNAILTPHTGEAAAFLGVDKKDLLASPEPYLKEASQRLNAHILYKSYNMYVASPSMNAETLNTIEKLHGEEPVLAQGGSGDLLAGFCGAFLARSKNTPGLNCRLAALAAAELLLESARLGPKKILTVNELAFNAETIAGKVFLP